MKNIDEKYSNFKRRSCIRFFEILKIEHFITSYGQYVAIFFTSSVLSFVSAIKNHFHVKYLNSNLW